MAKIRVRVLAPPLGDFLVPTPAEHTIAQFKANLEQLRAVRSNLHAQFQILVCCGRQPFTAGCSRMCRRLCRKAAEKNICDAVVITCLRSLAELDDADEGEARVGLVPKRAAARHPCVMPRAHVAALCCAVGDVLRDTEDVHVTFRMVGGAAIDSLDVVPTAALSHSSHDAHEESLPTPAATHGAIAAQSSLGTAIATQIAATPADASDAESARASMTVEVPIQQMLPTETAASVPKLQAASLDSLPSSTDIGEGLLLLQQLKFSEAAEWFTRALAACPPADPQRPRLLCHRAGAALGA